MKETNVRICAGTPRGALRWSLFLTPVIVIGLFSPIYAQVTNIEVVPVDNSSGAPELSGYVTTDVLIDFDGIYTGSQLYIALEQGSIYQDPLGLDTAPLQGVIDLAPSVAFDSFVTIGAETAGGPLGPANIIGGAINLSGDPTAVFDSSQANVAWFPVGGSDITDQGDFLSARISLSDDAVGEWRYLASAEFAFTAVGLPGDVVGTPPGGITIFGTGAIENGSLVLGPPIPEPSTLASGLLLACLGGAAWVRRSRFLKARAA